jgi:hypothetical protein
MSGNPPNVWWTNLMQRVRSEPKKAAALAVLLSVLAMLWVKAFSTASPSPSVASARTAQAAKPPAPVGRSGAQFTPAAAALRAWSQKPGAPPPRNLFAVNLQYFAADQARTQPQSQDSPGFWAQVAKSLSSQADHEKARQIFVENLQLRAAKLELRSTLSSGGVAKALVNDTLVGVGDTIDGFRVVGIEARRIIVERDGVKLEVQSNSNK